MWNLIVLMVGVSAAANGAGAVQTDGIGWQWIPGILGGGGLMGAAVLLATRKLFSGTFRIGGGADDNQRVCLFHESLVNHVEEMHGTVSNMDGKLDILVRLMDGKKESVPDKKE